MPKPWAEVAADPEYKALPPDQQEAARQRYFDKVVAPNVPEAEREAVRQRFNAKTAPAPQPTAGVGERFASGLRDAGEGLLQTAHHGAQGIENLILPEDSEMRRADQAGVDAEDARLRQREAALKAQGYPQGFDWARTAGNLVNPLNWAGAGAKGGGFLSHVLSGGITGARAAANEPVTSGEGFARGKAEQAVEGALGGAAVGGAGKALASAIAPKLGAAQQALVNEGVQLTPGQLMGGAALKTESVGGKAPIVGSAIRDARDRATDTFNIAAMNKVLEPLGAKMPKGANAGRGAVETANKIVKGEFDRLLPTMNYQADKPFITAVTDAKTAVEQLPADHIRRFNTILQDEIDRRLSPQGAMSGTDFGDVTSRLGRVSAQLRASADSNDRALGYQVSKVREAMLDNIARNEPKKAAELAKAREAYGRLVRINDAAVRRAGSEGLLTPADLLQSERKMSGGVGKSQFRQGQGPLQPLAEAGQAALGPDIPASAYGSPFGRATEIGAGIGALSGHIAPVLGAAGGALALRQLYSPRVIALLNAYAKAPGPERQAIARMIQGALPGASAAAGAAVGEGAP